MAIQSSYKSSFYTSVEVGVRRKIKKGRSVELPGGALLWRAAAKPLMILVSCTFMVNLVFMFAITMQGHKVDAMELLKNNVEKEFARLEIEKNRVNSLEYMAGEAKAKLNLIKAEKSQIVLVTL